MDESENVKYKQGDNLDKNDDVDEEKLLLRETEPTKMKTWTTVTMRTIRNTKKIEMSDDLKICEDGEGDDGNTEAAVNVANDNMVNYGSIGRSDHENITYLGSESVKIIQKRHMIAAVRCTCANKCGK